MGQISVGTNTYGLWLLVRLRGKPVSGPSGTLHWRWIAGLVLVSLLLEAWIMLRMQS